jgi:AraC-like DNA-binding protein
MEDLLTQMRDRVLRHADSLSSGAALPRVGVAIQHQHTAPETAMCGPGICLVLQGTKQLIIGEQTLRQTPGRSFASLIEIPTTRCVLEIDSQKPYVAAGLTFDHAVLAELIAETPTSLSHNTVNCFSIATGSRDLFEAWDRHLALLDSPGDIPALSALRERELLYRLLQSPHGSLLRQNARDEGRSAQVRRAIDWMRANFDQPLMIKDLAEMARMSVPSFNRHFRTATSTSPIQYQKMLRLQAARYLLAKNSDVTLAAYAVGYESASQFSREYSRLFGCAPKKSALALRENLDATAAMMF